MNGGVNFGGTGKLRMVSGPQYFNAAKSYARAAASSSSYAPAWIDMCREGDDDEQHATPLMLCILVPENFYFFLMREREDSGVGAPPLSHACHAKAVAGEPHSPR